VRLEPDLTEYQGIDRRLILDQEDLEKFGTVWRRFFRDSTQPLPTEARELFAETYAAEISPKAIRRFISETDKILLRHTLQEYQVLEMLAENRQFLVQGGPGTGKTWMAFEQAFRWAEQGEGQQVLLLCYNQALARTLIEMASRRKPKTGEVTVRGWEMLARELYASAGLLWKEPNDSDERRKFFEENVPASLWRIVHRKAFKPQYDALVVDEAQDHNTDLPNPFVRQLAQKAVVGKSKSAQKKAVALCNDHVGWWSIYFKLLREENAAPIAAFYDPGQRPFFRLEGEFDPSRLRRYLTHPVQVRLNYALRYSRPVFNFLQTLKSEATDELVNQLKYKGSFLEGPEVEVYEATSDHIREKIQEIINRWVVQGYCRVDEILILSPYGARARSSLAGCDHIGGWTLTDEVRQNPDQLLALSINKAKGLDSLAVILIDVEPFGTLEQDQDRLDYFTGASRARQLLAIVHK
jgi:hypothetical protein